MTGQKLGACHAGPERRRRNSRSRWCSSRPWWCRVKCSWTCTHGASRRSSSPCPGKSSRLRFGYPCQTCPPTRSLSWQGAPGCEPV
ncbi:unnamed protein product [Effrenium voratum]|nr:unnamed protein product [Effrenium voratum]